MLFLFCVYWFYLSKIYWTRDMQVCRRSQWLLVMDTAFTYCMYCRANTTGSSTRWIWRGRCSRRKALWRAILRRIDKCLRSATTKSGAYVARTRSSRRRTRCSTKTSRTCTISSNRFSLRYGRIRLTWLMANCEYQGRSQNFFGGGEEEAQTKFPVRSQKFLVRSGGIQKNLLNKYFWKFWKFILKSHKNL